MLFVHGDDSAQTKHIMAIVRNGILKRSRLGQLSLLYEGRLRLKDVDDVNRLKLVNILKRTYQENGDVSFSRPIHKAFSRSVHVPES